MRLKYNAPVSITFALISCFILLADKYLNPSIVQTMFTAEGKLSFQPDDFPAYIRLVSHALGHASWDHLFDNLKYILLLGPILEERYGSRQLAFMMVLTSLTNGLVNAFFFSTELLGASGIVFMMIILISFAGVKQRELPLSFIAVVGIFAGAEVWDLIYGENSVSQVAHLVGALCGAAFGIFLNVSNRKSHRDSLAPRQPGEGVARTY